MTKRLKTSHVRTTTTPRYVAEKGSYLDGLGRESTIWYIRDTTRDKYGYIVARILLKGLADKAVAAWNKK
jgi:hypothetical protein